MGRKPGLISEKRIQTQNRIVWALGDILLRDGYKAIGINALAREAMVSKKLIYDYFDTIDGVLEEYIKKIDFWLHLGEMEELRIFDSGNRDSIKKAVSGILKKHFEYFAASKPMQAVVLWQLTEKQAIIDSLCRTKEIMGGQLFEAIEALPEQCFENLRFVFACIIYSTYGLILHAKNNTSPVCGIFMRYEKDKQDFLKTIDYMVENAFKTC